MKDKYNLTKSEEEIMELLWETDRKYLYVPLITRLEYKQKGAERFIRDSYSGSFMNFVSALSGGEMISKEEAEDIRKLLEENKL